MKPSFLTVLIAALLSILLAACGSSSQPQAVPVVTPAQSIPLPADLETFGTRLVLPDGWTYHPRVLTEDSELRVDGLAYIINDNMYNAYQKVTP